MEELRWDTTTARVQAPPLLKSLPWALPAPDRMRAALLEGGGMAPMPSPALSQAQAPAQPFCLPGPDPLKTGQHGDCSPGAPAQVPETQHLVSLSRPPFPIYGCSRPGGSYGVLSVPVQARTSCYCWWLSRPTETPPHCRQ